MADNQSNSSEFHVDSDIEIVRGEVLMMPHPPTKDEKGNLIDTVVLAVRTKNQGPNLVSRKCLNRLLSGAQLAESRPLHDKNIKLLLLHTTFSSTLLFQFDVQENGQYDVVLNDETCKRIDKEWTQDGTICAIRMSKKKMVRETQSRDLTAAVEAQRQRDREQEERDSLSKITKVTIYETQNHEDNKAGRVQGSIVSARG